MINIDDFVLSQKVEKKNKFIFKLKINMTKQKHSWGGHLQVCSILYFR